MNFFSRNPAAVMIFNKFYYDDMKDFFHPNVRRYIEHHPDPDDECIYLPPYHSCSSKTRGGRRKNIMYRNGDICCTGGQFHPGKMMVWKFRPSVVYLRYMSTVDEKLKYLFRSKGDCIYNFKTKQYVHLRDTPIRDRYERFVQSKNNYLKNPNIWF